MAKPEHGFSGADVRAIMAAAEGAAVISAAGVEDDAYGAGWNGDADHAPSQNAVYDILATIIADLNGFPDSLKNLAATEIAELEAIGTTTISAAQWGYLGSTSANGGALIGAADYAAMMALLSGEAGATFDLNDQQLSNIKSLAFNDGGATCTQVKDEDTMASNSATMLATQQSIKAYADIYKANKTTAAWSKTIGSGGDYTDWTTMIADMPDLIGHAVTVEIKAGTTLTETCELKNKHGITVDGEITIQAEKYFPTSGVIASADSATATTLRDAALATAALGDDYFNGCWIFIVAPGTSAITGINVGGAGAASFEVAGDLTARYLAGDVLIAEGCNDAGYYTIKAGGSTHAGGTTTIPVDEAIIDGTVAGTVQTQGVLENGFVPITDYDDGNGDVVVASWPAADAMVGDSYIIVGALIDGNMDILNICRAYLYGVGIKDASVNGLQVDDIGAFYAGYCGFYNCGRAGISTHRCYADIRYCGIIGNNTDNHALYGGVRATNSNTYLYRCAISDNNQRGFLIYKLAFGETYKCFGDGNGAWGMYALYSGQAKVNAPECSGSAGNHSDEGTADTAADDQAAVYT